MVEGPGLFRGLLPLLRVWGGHFDFKVLELRKFGDPK